MAEVDLVTAGENAPVPDSCARIGETGWSVER